MPTPEDPLAPLREALTVSPTNVPLRLHVADALVAAGRPDEAEALLKDGLSRTANDSRLKLALARVYLKQGKYSAGIVVCEALVRGDSAPAALVVLARLFLRSGEPDKAADAYRKAVLADPSVADQELAEQLDADADADDPDEDTPLHGRVPAGPVEAPDDIGQTERPKLSFADVGGMDDVKDEIAMKVIQPLAHPELFAAYGKKVGGGVLLYGPPGCGKTHLARATAGEAKASFQAVGIHDVLEMWIGQSEKQLHAIFEGARRRKPCVLFFDEVDALGAKRSDMSNAAGRQSINQFLSELDGASGDNDGLLVLAATNAPWHVDPAFRRPGRFDRLIFVPPPDAPARASIFGVLLRGKPCEAIDLTALAKKTERFSGADLKAVVDLAVDGKLQEAVKTGIPKPLTTKDLLAAAREQKPSTREWFADARNYALYANDGGQYDDLAKYLKLR
jgi:transitional endoplasmic reticulum ATPase